MHSSASSPHRTNWSVLIAVLGAALVATLLFTVAQSDPVAAQPNGETCYAVSDLGGNDQGTNDNLISITNGAVTVIGQMGTNDAEAFAIRPGDTAYAWSGADGLGLVTVNLATGATAAAGFDVPGSKVEGLTWANTEDADLTNDILYVVRLDGTVQGYTPSGAAAGISANVLGGGFNEGTDIAWDPIADQLYVIRTTTSAGEMPDQTQIVTVSPAVGVVGPSAEDLEGLGFTSDGTMIGTTGDDGASADNLYVVNKANGTVGASQADLSSSIDNEDVDCIDPALPVVPTPTPTPSPTPTPTPTPVPAQPGVLGATISDACANSDGTITVGVSYEAGQDPADYSITVQGQAPRAGTLTVDSPPVTETFSGLADGSYSVVVTNTTNSVVLGSTTIAVQCDPTEPASASASVECVDGAGKVTVTMFNPTGAEVAFLATVLGVAESNNLAGQPTFVGGSIYINEFLADNETGLADGAGEQVDWIELYNPTGATVNISGWSITDDADDVTKQVIPAGTQITPGGYLYLFQGDGNLAGSGPTFDFGLSGGGEYLGLYDDAGAVVSAYSPEYPDQFTDVSYGRGSDGVVGYFAVPSTPGNSANGVATSTVPMAMEMFTGLPDGPVPVVVTADGQEIAVANTPVTVDCDLGTVTATVAGDCQAEDGRITTTVTNATSAATSIAVAYSAGGGPGQTSTVAANTSGTIVRTGRADATYTVTVTADGAQIAQEQVTISCDPVIVENPAVTIAKNVNGQTADAAPGPTISVGSAVNYTYIVSNSGDVALSNVTVTDSDAGLTIDCDGDNVIASMAPGASVTCTASTSAVAGLVTTTATASGTSPANATVTATNAANYTGETVAAGTVTTSLDTPCVGGNGAVYWTVVNGTNADVTAVLKVTGLSDRTTVVPANTTATLIRSGRPDGVYLIEGLIDGTVRDSGSITFDCDPDVEPTPTPVPATPTPMAPTPTPVPVSTAEIGDLVFADTNGNGIRDNGEAGVGGINVNLWTDTNGDGAPVVPVASTTTGAAGNYLFAGLDPALTYWVQFVTGGFTISPQNVGNNDTIDSDANPANGIAGPINLVGSQFDNTVDVGLFDNGIVTFEKESGCEAGNGVFRVTINNGTLVDADVVLSLTGLSDKLATATAGQTTIVSRTGRPDGVYTWKVTLDGGVLIDEIVTINCDTNAQIISPVPGGTLSCADNILTWTGTADEYWVWVGSTAGGKDYYDSLSLGNATTTTMTNLPQNGSTIYVRLWYREAGGTWNFIDTDYTACQAATASVSITSPVANSTLACADNDSISWTGSANEYWVYAGSTVGANDYFDSGNIAGATTATLTNLPQDGSPVYVRVWYRLTGGAWSFVDEVYTASTTPTGNLTTPIGGSVLGGPNQTFAWTGTSDQYWLYVGGAQGARDYYDSGNLGNTLSAAVTGLPQNGSDIWARLWFRTATCAWQFVDQQYTANTGVFLPTATITAPAAGSTFTCNTSTDLTWTGTADEYQVVLGTTQGGNDIEDSGVITGATSYTMANVPTDGSTFYIRLWYRNTGAAVWQFVDQVHVSSVVGSANLTAPAAGATVAATETATWTGTAAQYWFYAGSTVGGKDYYDSGNLGGALTTTVTGIPQTGQPVYFRLWYRDAGCDWKFIDQVNDSGIFAGPTGLITSPIGGSTLVNASETLTWTGTADEFWVYAGSTQGSNNYYDSANLGNVFTDTITGLPENGSTVWVRLWYRTAGGVWQFTDASYISV